MAMNITGRHMVVTPALRDYAEEGIRKLETHGMDSVDADVILSVEKKRHKAEFLVHHNGRSFIGKGETDEMYASIDKAVAIVQKQFRKTKEKVIARKRGARSDKASG